MKSFIEQAQLYAHYHQKPLTRYSHMIAVPLLLFSLMILLGFIHIVIQGWLDINLAEVATLLLLAHYFRLYWRLALVLTPIMICLLWLANIISEHGPTHFALLTFMITFILAWAFQLFGHFFEGKRPTFSDNLSLSLVAPLYLSAEIFFMAGKMQALKEQISNQEMV